MSSRASGPTARGDYEGFGGTDIVIEAVFEELAIKQQVIREVEAARGPRGHDQHVNAAGPRRGGRLASLPSGSHALLLAGREDAVARGHPDDATSADAIMTAVQFGRCMGKTVIVVADSPGFWVNRILLPYLNEAGFLLEERRAH